MAFKVGQCCCGDCLLKADSARSPTSLGMSAATLLGLHYQVLMRLHLPYS